MTIERSPFIPNLNFSLYTFYTDLSKAPRAKWGIFKTFHKIAVQEFEQNLCSPPKSSLPQFKISNVVLGNICRLLAIFSITTFLSATIRVLCQMELMLVILIFKNELDSHLMVSKQFDEN